MHVAADFLRCSLYSNYDQNFHDLDSIIQDTPIHFFGNYLYYTARNEEFQISVSIFTSIKKKGRVLAVIMSSYIVNN